MKATLVGVLTTCLFIGSVYAENKHCKNISGKCKCRLNHSRTFVSTGRYRIDLSRGPVELNFNPSFLGYYSFKVYERSIVMKLTECGKNDYVPASWKRDGSSHSLTATLCSDKTYKLYLKRVKRKTDYVILEISKKYSSCSRRSSGCGWGQNIIRISNGNFCGNTRRIYYHKKGYNSSSYHHSKYKKRKTTSRSGFGFSISF